MYRRIFDLIDQKSLTFSIRWMPSHLKPYDVRPNGVSHLDVIGNNFADEEAGMAAKSHCVELNASSQFFHWRNLAGKIQRRLVAILQDLPDRKKEKKGREAYDNEKGFANNYESFSLFRVMYFSKLAILSNVPGAITRAIGKLLTLEIGSCLIAQILVCHTTDQNPFLWNWFQLVTKRYILHTN